MRHFFGNLLPMKALLALPTMCLMSFTLSNQYSRLGVTFAE